MNGIIYRNSFLIFLSFLLSFGSYLFMSYGIIGMTYDSKVYLQAAENISRGMGFSINSMNNSPEPVSLYAPLYSFLIAGMKFLVKDTLQSAILLNAIIRFLSSLTFFLLAKRLNLGKKYYLLLIIVYIFSFLNFKFSIYIWTESLYLLITLVSFYLYTFLDEKRTSYLFFIVFGLSVGLTVISRYIGITNLIFFNLLIISDRRTGLYKKLLFVLSSIIPVLLWLIRNYLTTGFLFGNRGPSEYSLGFNLLQTLISMNRMILNGKTFLPYYLIIVAVTGYFIFRKKIKIDLKKIVLNKFILFSVLYLIVLNISASLTHFDQIEERLVFPVYTIIILGFVQILADYKEKVIFYFAILCLAVPVGLFPLKMKALFTEKLEYNHSTFHIL